MRKMFALLLVVIMIMTSLPFGGLATTIAPCNNHQWVYMTDQAATCLKVGYWVRYCRVCGMQEDGEYPALGHDWHWVTEQAATCTGWGRRSKICSRCNAFGDGEEIEPLGHNYVFYQVKQEPTCTEEGIGQEKCSRCDLIRAYSIPALGHDWGEWYVVEYPAPGKDGYEEHECNRCHITEQRPLTMEDLGASSALVLVGNGYTYDSENNGFWYSYYDYNMGNATITVNGRYTSFNGTTQSDMGWDYIYEPSRHDVYNCLYTFTAEDIARGYAYVEVYETAIDAAGAKIVSNTVTWKVPVPVVSALSSDFILTEQEYWYADDMAGVWYFYASLNNGKSPVTITSTNLRINDDNYNNSRNWTLDPGDRLPCGLLHTFTAEDYDRGYVTIEIYETAVDENGQSIRTNTLTWEVPVPKDKPAPASLVLSNEGYKYEKDNSGFWYLYYDTNEGSTPITVNGRYTTYNGNTNADTWWNFVYEPGYNSVHNCPYTFTEEDIARGYAYVEVYETAKDVTGGDIISNTVTWKVPVPGMDTADPKLKLVQQGYQMYDDQSGFYWYYSIENTGNVMLINCFETRKYSANGTKYAAGDIDEFPAGGKEDFAHAYSFNADDIARGYAYIELMAQGFDEVTDTWINSNTISWRIPVPESDANGAELTLSQSEITYGEDKTYYYYDFTITNTGNVVLTDITVFTSIHGGSLQQWETGEALESNDFVAYVGNPKFTVKDYEVGYAYIEKYATGIDPAGNTVTSNTIYWKVPVPDGNEYKAELVMYNDGYSYSEDGTEYKLYYTKENSGNVPLTLMNEYESKGEGFILEDYLGYDLEPGATSNSWYEKAFKEEEIKRGYAIVELYTDAADPFDRVITSNTVSWKIPVPGSSSKQNGMVLTNKGYIYDEDKTGFWYYYNRENTGSEPLHDVNLNLTYNSSSYTVSLGEDYEIVPGGDGGASRHLNFSEEDKANGVCYLEMYVTGLDPDGNVVTSNTISWTVPMPGSDAGFNELELTNHGFQYMNDKFGFWYYYNRDNKGTKPLHDVKLNLTHNSYFWTLSLGTDYMIMPGGDGGASRFELFSEEDEANGVSYLEMYVTGLDPDGNVVTSNTINWEVPVPDTENKGAGLTIEYHGYNMDEDGKLVFSYCVYNSGSVPLYSVAVHEDFNNSGSPTDSAPNVGEWMPGYDERVEVTASYKPTQDDYDRGYVDFSVYASGMEANQNVITSNLLETSAPLEGPMPLNGVVITKEVISSPEDGIAFKLGDEINYLITVVNYANECFEDVYVYDVDRYDTRYLGNLEYFEPEIIRSFTYTHTVTEEDVQDGFYKNTCFADVFGMDPEADNYYTEVWGNTVTVKCNGDCGKLSVHKARTNLPENIPLNGPNFIKDETIKFKITVANSANKCYRKVIVHDVDSYSDIILGEIDYLNPEGSLDYTFDHVVTQDDLDAGYYTNGCYLEAYDMDDNYEYVDGNTITLPIGNTPKPVPSTDVSVQKTILTTPKDNISYKENEIIYYEITVTNENGGDCHNVYVYDPLFSEDCSQPVDHFDDIAISATTGFFYTVTAEDVESGAIWNQAYATYVALPDPSEHIAYSNWCKAIAGKPSGKDTPFIYKGWTTNPLNGSYFVKGETISYHLYLENTTDRRLYNVYLCDYMISPSPLAEAAYLDPGEYLEAFPYYEVSAYDVADGKQYLYNTVYGYYYNEEGGDEDAVMDTCAAAVGIENPDIVERPKVEITKTVVSSSADPAFYVPGETVSYLITVTNLSDVEITDLWIYDYLYNGTTDILTYPGQISVLKPHESYPVGESYTIEEWDADEGYLTNVASADFCSGDYGYDWVKTDAVTVNVGRKPLPPDTQTELPALVKYVTSSPAKGYYEEGDWISYAIVLYNYTGETFYNINRFDILLDTTAHYYDGLPYLDNTPATMTVYYQVKASDVDAGKVTNYAWVTLEDKDGNVYTINSNEVVVPTKPVPIPPVPPTPGTAYCIPTLTGVAETATIISEAYCSEHAAVNAGVLSQIAAADGDEGALEAAYLYAVAQWTMALDGEYRHLAAERPEFAETLENDRNVFENWLAAEMKLLEASGLNKAESSRYRYEVLRDKCCELCYAFHETESIRKDSFVNTTELIIVTPVNECSIGYDDMPLGSVIDEKLCQGHTPMAVMSNKLMNAVAGKDDTVKAAAWERVYGYWKNELAAKFTSMSGAVNPACLIAAATDRVMFETVLTSEKALYGKLYEGHDEITNELLTRFVIRELIRLCETIK